MATERDYQGLYDRIAALRDRVTSRLASDLITNPQLADALNKQIDDMLQSVVDADAKALPPPDKGLAELAGIGQQAAKDFGQARIPPGVIAYDETIPSARIIAVGDVYYIYQHEKIGVFRAVERPSYDQLVNDQVSRAVAKGRGSVQDLLDEGAWTID